jgi:hypothetical protein
MGRGTFIAKRDFLWDGPKGSRITGARAPSPANERSSANGAGYSRIKEEKVPLAYIADEGARGPISPPHKPSPHN